MSNSNGKYGYPSRVRLIENTSTKNNDDKNKVLDKLQSGTNKWCPK